MSGFIYLTEAGRKFVGGQMQGAGSLTERVPVQVKPSNKREKSIEPQSSMPKLQKLPEQLNKLYKNKNSLKKVKQEALSSINSLQGELLKDLTNIDESRYL